MCWSPSDDLTQIRKSLLIIQWRSGTLEPKREPRDSSDVEGQHLEPIVKYKYLLLN